MPKLSKEAAVEFALFNRFGSVNTDLHQGICRSSRTARLLLQSSTPEVWLSDSVEDLESDLQHKKRPNSEKVLTNFLKSEINRALSWQRPAAPEIVEKRISACMQCPNREIAPDSKLYYLGRKIFRPSGDDICSLCGCFIAEKAKRQSEKCPEANPENSAQSRWEEPL